MTEIFTYTAYRQLCQMFLAIIFFHSSEYIIAIFIHGTSNVTLKSLLISKNYLAAMIFSLLEYFIEIVLFPGLKEHWWVSNLGLAMVIVGEIIRKSAIITAGHAFTHLIRINRDDHHKLITHGIYRFVRHPAYCGFFIWSVGTQIMLCNPVSTIGFAIVVWRFFMQRIPYEEYFLRQFFGPQYEEYALRVTSGVPFIKWGSVDYVIWVAFSLMFSSLSRRFKCCVFMKGLEISLKLNWSMACRNDQVIYFLLLQLYACWQFWSWFLGFRVVYNSVMFLHNGSWNWPPARSDNLVDFQSVSIPGVSSPKSLSQMASSLLWWVYL